MRKRRLVLTNMYVNHPIGDYSFLVTNRLVLRAFGYVMQKHGTRFTGEPPLFHTNVNFQLLQTLSKCGLQHLKTQNVQLYLIQCHPPSRVPRRFQTPTAAFHCCTLAAPKASTPFKQHFDEHMVNELRLCSIYVEYSIVVIIHHNSYHNSSKEV